MCDGARHWHNEHGRSVDMKVRNFTAAVLGHSTISHSYNPARWPYDAAIGVAIGGGAPLVDGWMGFLERGRLKLATPYPANGGPAWAPGFVTVNAQGPKW